MDFKIVKCVSTREEFNLEKFKELDIGVEVQDFTTPNLEKDQVEEVFNSYKEKLKGFTYTKSLHGPYLDLKPASPDKDIRRISQKKYLDTLQVAKKLNMDYIIFHSQINPWLREERVRQINNKQHRDFWHRTLDQIKDFTGTILLENIFEDSPLFLKELVETINLPKVKICLDIGHAKLDGNQPLENWIKELGAHIEYVHLHWNRGLYDEHHIPKDENIKYILNLLLENNIKPIIALEYYVENLEREIERIRNLMAKP